MPTIQLGATRLAYTERGSGPSVLLIHGTGTYSETFEPLLDELPASVRAIAYDRRGFGASAGPPARTLGRHVEDAAALLEGLDARPATVVGSSSGGVLALRLAIARPDLVAALVLIEPVYQLAFVPSASASAAIARVYLHWAVRRDPKGAALRFYRWATAYTGGGNQFDAYPERWQRVGFAHAATALRELPLVPISGPSRSAMRGIAKPTAVLVGNAGQRVFRRTARRALDAIPGARAVDVPGAAHLLYTDRPGACAAAIVDAVGGVAGDVEVLSPST
ncbi:MAG: alpha/beta hydrolase [Thermoleophilaceae bacterium]